MADSNKQTDLTNAVEQAKGWLDDAIECAGRGDKAGAAENADDALPWLKTAYTLAGKLRGCDEAGEQLQAVWQSIREMEQPYEADALVAMRARLDITIPAAVDGDDDEAEAEGEPEMEAALH